MVAEYAVPIVIGLLLAIVLAMLAAVMFLGHPKYDGGTRRRNPYRYDPKQETTVFYETPDGGNTHERSEEA